MRTRTPPPPPLPLPLPLPLPPSSPPRPFAIWTLKSILPTWNALVPIRPSFVGHDTASLCHDNPWRRIVQSSRYPARHRHWHLSPDGLDAIRTAIEHWRFCCEVVTHLAGVLVIATGRPNHVSVCFTALVNATQLRFEHCRCYFLPCFQFPETTTNVAMKGLFSPSQGLLPCKVYHSWLSRFPANTVQALVGCTMLVSLWPQHTTCRAFGHSI